MINRTLFMAAASLVGLAMASQPVVAKKGGAMSHHQHHWNIPEHLYIPPANEGARDQFKALLKEGEFEDAGSLAAMMTTPQSVWLVGSSADEIKQTVRQHLWQARMQFNATPVFVVYNIPFRDCASYSAGGATNADEYLEWIDAIAETIGESKAKIMLEPDGLGIIPHYTPLGNDSPEWCQPDEVDAETAADERFYMMTEAVERFNAMGNVDVYLDATHVRWLGVGDIADRLSKAGIADSAGFFLNASNYQASDQLIKYGEWISSCLAFANNDEEGGWRLGHYDWCASQYYPANLDDTNTWVETDDWYVSNLGTAEATTHFVIDTSRNGQGRWVGPEDAPGDVQDWCNPPERGLGLRPTLDTGIDLVDAYLWIKIPGESDGECTRWEPAGSPDPVRGIDNPPAGAWFPEMALELIRNAEEGALPEFPWKN